MGFESMKPDTDKIFEWPLTALLRQCQNVRPEKRLSTKEILEYMVNSDSKSLESYRQVLNLELNSPVPRPLQLFIEDFEDSLCSLTPPSHFQNNLGQLV